MRVTLRHKGVERTIEGDFEIVGTFEDLQVLYREIGGQIAHLKQAKARPSDACIIPVQEPMDDRTTRMWRTREWDE